jgi:ATP adenylyltransferase
MSNPLWAPWRMQYILGDKRPSGACIFCGFDAASEAERDERLVVTVGRRASVVLNRYPFAAGHLLVVPHAHVSSLAALEPEDADALFRLVRASAGQLTTALKAEGLNIGMNEGAVAGAGVAAHLHVHIVPRWAGDTNFMPVLADTRVVPQALEATREHLKPYFRDLAAT